MTIWYNEKDGSLHDDMDGTALSLPGWPKGMVEATEEQINPLGNTQAAKIAAIDLAYSAAVTANISFTTEAGENAIFQADENSQKVLSDSAQGYDMVGTVPAGFFWRSADNKPVTFTLADLKGLYQAILNRGWMEFQKRTALKEDIAEATTIAEVQAITW